MRQGRKKKAVKLLFIIIILTGILILLYPTVSNYIAEKQQENVIVGYNTKISETEQDVLEREWERAKEYNRNPENYKHVLNIRGDGVMGYISIPEIDVNIPIYHSATESSLNKGIGHVEQTGLPIGGKGNHPVLTGHRGLPNAQLFTRLDEMEIGDLFFIYVLDKTLAYSVDQIKVVLPKEVEKIKAQRNRDIVTLVTCTPYGINSHRLLVRGTRIENVRPPLYVTTEAFQIDSLLATPAVAAPILFVLFIVLMVKYRKPTGKKYKVEEIAYEKFEDE